MSTRRISSNSRNDFKAVTNREYWYDLFSDWDLIEASINKQYGIRIRKDVHDMQWGELSSLISGLMPDTPLGRIVEIRCENDKERLKNFTQEQLQIRSDWRNKQVINVKEIDMKAVLEQMKQALVSIAT